MNPLFTSFQRNQQGSNSNADLQLALQNLAKQIAPTGLTPEQIVRQKIKNGEMTQAQFEQYRQIANRLTGRNN